jgi:hypothetical protein
MTLEALAWPGETFPLLSRCARACQGKSSSASQGGVFGRQRRGGAADTVH